MMVFEQRQLYSDPDVDSDWPALYAERAKSAQDQRLRDYYAAGMVHGDTLLKDAPLLAVDFETTGLDPRTNGIVSIGAVPFSLARIRLAEARQWVLKPRFKLTEDSVVIHGITHSDVDSAPDLDDVLGDLLDMFKGHVWVVHYRGIEREFFKAALLTRLGEYIDFPVVDTMMLEARLHRGASRGAFKGGADLGNDQPWYKRWSSLLGSRFGAEVSIRLAESRQRYNLPFYSPHDAATDALACAELFQAQVAHHYSPDTPLRDVLAPYP